MTGSQLSAAEMRRAFDSSFAGAGQTNAEKHGSFVEVLVSGEIFVVPVLSILGLANAGRIVAIPSRAAELVGLTVIRGSIVPVFDLGLLLGLKAVGRASALMLVKCDVTVALVLHRYGRSIRAEISAAERPGYAGHVRQFARTASQLRPIIDIPEIAATIRSRAGVNAGE